MMELNKIYKGDCVDIITKKITNNSVHLTIFQGTL